MKDDQSAPLKFNKNEINTAELIKFINSKIDLKDITTKESDLEDIFIKLLKKLVIASIILLTSSCSSTLIKDIDTNSFSYMNIKPDSEFSNVILAIHGYNDILILLKFLENTCQKIT